METKNKLTIKEITKEANNISPEVIASEVLTWVCNNVEYFIDNQKKAFKLDLIVDSNLMPETSKLQELFQSVSEDSKSAKETKELVKCREVLNGVTKNVHSEMKKSSHLETLFKRMSFFYEMVGFSNGRPLLKELQGAVDISEFEYEDFSVAVKVKAPMYQVRDEDGNIKNIASESKEYDIPAGFSMWIEIAFRDTRAQKSLF